MIEGIGAERPSQTLSDSGFLKIAAFMRERTGISLERGSRRIICSRLQRHVVRTGSGCLDEYIDLVTSGAAAEETQIAIGSLTTNTTRFCREPEHFGIFETEVVPVLARAVKRGERVRLWSAACSSGEEAYTLAAHLVRAFPEAPKHDIRILATDIDQTVLQRAEAAEYTRPAESLVSDELAKIMFEELAGTADRVRIRPQLRNLVTVRYLNFFDPWPVSGPFHTIFCRNAAIYMDSAAQSVLWSGLARVLHPEGVLFIGHSERLTPELNATFAQIGRNAFRSRETGDHKKIAEHHINRSL
ncbi:CheR family methyltransferase [Palleronia sp.]|uniref:CheR family methyltransferase n=1 Tax=Palleronia sp. TaxID=1940284 RepID=UPI0035C7AFD7